jgi:iron-sulfur cluster assembly accessory protein
VFERDGAKVIIDTVSLDFVKGATVDFEVDLIRSAFVVVDNTQSESACGCKSSFAMKNFSAHPALD